MEPAAIRIGYSQGDPQIPFRAALEYGIKERAAHHGVQLHLQPAFSIDEQCSAIVQLADAKVDVLLIGPIDSVGIVPAVAYANRVGVPVVTLDMALNDGEVASSVVSDSAHGALLAAERS
jgi:ribose transport system substrate-binding protein